MDNEIKDAMIEIGKKVASEVYSDLCKKSVTTTGDVVNLIPRAIKAALFPLEKYIVEKEYNLKELELKLQDKLKNIKEEEIVTPEANIAVPAIQYYAYSQNKEDIRNMYVNLLSKSMNKLIKNDVYPSYVEIIKQLTPDEAKIIKEIFNSGDTAVISLLAKTKIGKYVFCIKDYSLVGIKANCDNPNNIGIYINNLVRLGIIENTRGRYIANEQLYEELNNSEYIKNEILHIKESKSEYNIPKCKKGSIELTDFGKAFCKICII